MNKDDLILFFESLVSEYGFTSISIINRFFNEQDTNPNSQVHMMNVISNIQENLTGGMQVKYTSFSNSTKSLLKLNLHSDN